MTNTIVIPCVGQQYVYVLELENDILPKLTGDREQLSALLLPI